MSFHAAEAASCTRYWGTILIYNFAMEANRRGRYRRRQPPEKQINFFPSIPTLPSSVMGSFPEMMYAFIGVDVSCQSNITGMGNWQWRWWGNPHAYISADKGAVTTGLLLFLPLLPLPPSLSLSPSTSLMPPPFKSSPFSSHTKGFYVPGLSCPGYTCLPPSSSSTTPFGSLIYSSGIQRGGEGWGGDADSLLCSLTVK